MVYRRQRLLWVRVGGRAIQATRGSRVVMLGGPRPCLVTQHARRVRVWCERHGGWRQQGRDVFETSEPSLVTTFAGAFVAAGRRYILRARLANAAVRPGGLTVQGTRVEQSVFSLARNGRWRNVGGVDIDPTAPGGTQRPFGFSWNAEPCIAYNRLSGDPSRGPTVRVVCLHGGRWRAGQFRDVDVGLFPTASSLPGSSAVNVDGAAATGGAVYLGIDYFHGRRVDWRVVRAEVGNNGRPSDVSDSRAGDWNEQGSLYSIAGGVWAIRFDQRASLSGLRTRLRVLRIGSDGALCQIGRPLLRDAAFQGPLYYELAAARQMAYAMATIPRRNQPGNEVRVFVVDKRAGC